MKLLNVKKLVLFTVDTFRLNLKLIHVNRFYFTILIIGSLSFQKIWEQL